MVEGAGVGVVAAVAEFPGEVRDEEERVEEEADEVVEPLVVAESLVTALMGDDPEAGKDGALEEPVERPEEDGGERRMRREDVEERGGLVEEEG